MKYCLFILCILFLNSCNNQIESIKNATSTDSLNLSVQGSWKGYKGEPIWDIGPDSIFYYSENRSYYYFIHHNSMIVLYKNGPFEFKNIKVSDDTLFFKTGDMNAIAFKSKNKNSHKFKEGDLKNHLEDEIDNENIKKKILGEWGYEYKEGVFTWVFTKDSIFYTQLNKRYFYVQHGNNIIVLTEEKPIIMKDVTLKSDTFSFTTQDSIPVKAHRIFPSP